MKIKFYTKDSGKVPVAEFLNELPADERAKIAACLKNIEELGWKVHEFNSDKYKAHCGK